MPPDPAAAFEGFDHQVATAKTVRHDWLHRMVPLSKLLGVISKALPQTDAIDDGDRANWAARVPRICATELLIANRQPVPDDDESWTEWDRDTPLDDPIRAQVAGRSLWHLRRLGGIGGSESGPLVAARRGQRDWFSSPGGIAAEKLMKRLPDIPDFHCLRGIRAEGYIQQQAAREHGWTTSAKRLAAMTGGRVADAPWITGTPDDLVQWPGGRHLIVDYKAPSGDPMAEMRASGIPFNYAVQLHHYLAVARSTIDVPVEQMMLCAWDGDRWETLLLACPEDPELSHGLRAACADLWSHVMEGEIPRPPQSVPAEPDEETQDLVLTAFALGQTGKAVEAARKSLLSRIADRQRNAPPGSCHVGAAVLSARTTWDRKGLAELLDRHLGRPPAEWSTDAGDVDLDALTQQLHFAAREARRIESSVSERIEDATAQDELRALRRTIETLATKCPRRHVLDTRRAVAALEEAGADVSPCRRIGWQVKASQRSDPQISGQIEDVQMIARAGVESLKQVLREDALGLGDAEPQDAPVDAPEQPVPAPV